MSWIMYTHGAFECAPFWIVIKNNNTTEEEEEEEEEVSLFFIYDRVQILFQLCVRA